MELDSVLLQLESKYPGRYDILLQLLTFLTTTTPSCIHIHSPFSSRPAVSLVRSVLDATHTLHASIHGVECLSQRLFFDRVLQLLSGWCVSWDEGCESFGGGMYSGDVDGFIEGLRVISREKDPETKLVVVIERAERFKDNLPELMVPLTRMAELSGLPFTAVFISEVSWFDLRPPYGAAIDPFLIEVLHLDSQDAIATLVSLFPSRQTTAITPYSYHLKRLYAHYASALYSVCSPFLVDDHELSYLAAACWPNFVSPLLADWRVHSESSASTDENGNEAEAAPSPSELAFPSEDARMRLVRYFTPSFTRALEAVYPRSQYATQWSQENAPPPELRLSDLMEHGMQNERWDDRHGKERETRPALTTVAKYVLVAAFLASFNPAKTDMRLVGRAPDERGKKRRGGGPRKSRGGGRAKVPQKLLGPSAFPLDRLLAILGSLMEEHDQDVPKLNPAHMDDADDDYEPEKDTEMAVGQIQVSATILELVAMRLLHRTTPAEKLDGPPTFKCGVSQARAFELAREIGIGSLADFMWDPN